MPDSTFDPGGLTEFTPSDWSFDWSSLFADPFGSFSGGAPGSSFGLDQFFMDNETGQTVSYQQIMADQALAQAFQSQYGIGAPNTNVGDPGLGTLTGQPNTASSWFSNPQNLMALAAIAAPTGLGLAGLIQAMTSGGQSATTVNQPAQSATAQAAQQAAFQGFQGANQFAFGAPQGQQGLPTGTNGQPEQGPQQQGGLAGQLQGMAPLQQQAQLTQLQG